MGERGVGSFNHRPSPPSSSFFLYFRVSLLFETPLIPNLPPKLFLFLSVIIDWLRLSKPWTSRLRLLKWKNWERKPILTMVFTQDLVHSSKVFWNPKIFMRNGLSFPSLFPFIPNLLLVFIKWITTWYLIFFSFFLFFSLLPTLSWG